jgi:hypothetical protein
MEFAGETLRDLHQGYACPVSRFYVRDLFRSIAFYSDFAGVF